MSDVLDQLEEDLDSSDGTATPAQQYETKDGKPYRDDFLNLIDTRVQELRSICDAMDERDQWARLIEVIKTTLRRYFLIGQQHPYWNADAGQFQVGPDGISLGSENENDEEFYEEEFNIYRGYHDVFNAVFSQSPASTKAEPDKPRDGESVKAARNAEDYIAVYEKYNPAKTSQMEVATYLWTDTRIVAVTEFEPNEELCGIDENGDPLGAEITRYFGTLESKCPIIEPFRLWPYLKISREMDKLVAKYDNPKIAKEITGTAFTNQEVTNDQVALMSRLAVAEGIAQVTSDTLANLCTEDTYWLRPSAFEHLPEDSRAFWLGGDQENDDGSEDEVEGLCPKGIRVKWFGRIFAGGKHISMDAQCKMMPCRPGWGNTRGSQSDPLIPVQMEFNDAMGMYSEMLHKCIPATWLNIGVAQMGALMEQVSSWGNFHPFQPENGLGLGENIYEEQGFDVPQSFPAWLQNLQASLPQQLANIQPAMFGGNMEDQKTAKAYQQAKDMSMGVMAIVWVPYLEFRAGICWQAARLSARRENTQISTTIDLGHGKNKVVSLDTSVLGRGGYLCKAVTDQSFPESPTDKANKWLGIYQAAETNANGISAELLKEPDNRVALKDALGLDLVMPGEQSRDRQLSEWELMKPDKGGMGAVPDIQATQQKQQAKQQAAQQVVNQVAPGQPAPPVPPEPLIQKSSVPTRPGDDHIEHLRTCRRILESTEVWDMLDKEGASVDDLVLHAQEHWTKALAAGIPIPVDLMGFFPMPPPQVPGMPGAASGAAAPGAPAAPGAAALPGAAAPHPHPKAAPAATAGPAAQTAAPGGLNATPTA
jgi:hypothetical protein